MKKYGIIGALALSLMLLVTACGSDDKSVVGKWKDEAGNIVMEFTQDGQLIVTTTVKGKYKIDEAGNLVELGENDAAVETSQFTREGSDLTITTTDGKVVKLKKQ